MSTPPRAPARRNGHHEHPPADWPPPLEYSRRRLERAGEPDDEPRWLHLIGPLAITSALLIALGLWKLAELLARAL